MKKFMKYFIFIFALLVFPYKVFASFDAYISGDDVRIRTAPGTENSIIATVNLNTPITVDDKTLYSGTGCSDKWYKVLYNSSTGYVCSTYVVFKTEPYSGINVVDWTARVNSNNISVRTGAGVDTAYKESLSLGVNVTILSTVSGGTTNCSGGQWYKISYYSNSIGYVCSNLITKKADITNNTIADDYKAYLISQNFPESYWPFLNYLHIKYPNWIFKSGNTGVSFPSAVSGEERLNGMQTSNDNYRIPNTLYEGSWYRVNSGVNAFYLDPRNWLTEERIFMFEKLEYDDALEAQYPALVKSIFGTGSLSDDKYTLPMVNAGKTNRISPVHIASRIKQEVSANGSGSTNGGEFTWKGQTYSGFYNFFNIGAYARTVDGVWVSDAILAARLYAAKIISRDGNLWNDIEVAITEGSSFLASGYVNSGQGTLYYQKFNVGPNAYYNKYTHQYMTNIQAPATEGNSTYNSYKNSNVVSQAFVFEIPIYRTDTNNFPPYTSLPKSGNTDNNLSSLEVEGFAITPSFDKDVITYDSYVTKSIDKINVNAITSSSLASISGAGEILLTSDENVITVVVKSESGEEKSYTINVHKVDDSTTVSDVLLDAPLKTGDTILSRIKNSTTVDSLQTLLLQNGARGITFKSTSGTVITGSQVIGTNSTVTITTTTESKTFTVSVNGDTSGDGKVTILDLLEVQKHIKGASTLSGAALTASDTSGDSKTTILDLLEIVKHIKGASPL